MGKRRIILETILDTLNGARIIKASYTAKFAVKLFDVTLRKRDLPLFSIVSEPESLAIELSGVSASRTLRLIIQGFLLSKKTITNELSSESLLIGEDFVDAIITVLLDPISVKRFIGAFPGCGFSVTAIGPIIVEEYAMTGDLVYMSVPLTVEFLEN